MALNIISFDSFIFDIIFEKSLAHEALHTQIRKPVMNRNTHGEERRQVEKATRSERIAWIESSVGQLRSVHKVRYVGWRRCHLPKPSVKDASSQRHNE
ncbi:hypothetical protein T4C_7153 [Trichinella pseudospiralis]|uniref:Uncharacterized protein n=1 Tax=Trichinella pseudospiralis TaxID=6337 RepID=A0A0V1K4D5_TRIPS|nr:hypothetical protein T4C_7153 [Trichinella pseudospiralis]